MPRFTTFDNFASKAIVHPQFQEGSKAIVHPQFQEAAKAIVHPQFQPEAGRAIVHPQFQPEADGFMKLDDIKGEFASNVSVTYREDGANRFTTGGGGDSLTDAGLGNNLFHQGADVLTNVSYTSDRNGVWDDPATWSGASASVISEACTPTCPTGFAEDALVQQVNDFAGLISPDQMRPAEYFSHNPEWFAPGSAVDSWTEKTFGNGDGEILGGISQGNVFAPINVLRNGYDCEGAGAC